MPVSGARRFRSTSTASALSGETYRTRQRRCSSAGGGAAASRSSDQRNAASVLPEPVGATTRACSPLLIASQAPSWAAVGCSKAPVNQARVACENRSRADTLTSVPAKYDTSPSGERRPQYEGGLPLRPRGLFRRSGAGSHPVAAAPPAAVELAGAVGGALPTRRRPAAAADR